MKLRLWRRASRAVPDRRALQSPPTDEVWQAEVVPEGTASEMARPSVLAALVTPRQFAKLLVAAIGGAGAALLAKPPRRAFATYVGGAPADTVDRNLTIQGDLVVTSGPYGSGNVGIGTTTPQGKLDVAGAIRVNGAAVFNSGGIATQARYAALPDGRWGVIGERAWGDFPASNWSWSFLQNLQ